MSTSTKAPIVVRRDNCIYVTELGCRPRHHIDGDAGPFRIADLSDDGLANLMKQWRRMVEDHHAGAPKPSSIEKLRKLQLSRFCLRMRYGAHDRGTDSYDMYERLGWTPSYWLASNIDRLNAEHGRRHILDWRTAERVS